MEAPDSTVKQSRLLLCSDGRDYTVRDVVDAAHFRGELEAPWRELQQQLAAERQADESGAEVEGTALDEAAIAFRYDYELITAEETERWLEERALNLADFSSYFARVHWGRALGGRVHPSFKPYADATADERDLLVAQLIMSGKIESMALRLAWRVAARLAQKEEPDAADLAAERERFLAHLHLDDAALPAWLAALGRDAAWLEELLALEVNFRHSCTRLLKPELLEREVGAVRLPLTRFEVEMIELESRDAANEAFMCVRDDGMSMSEVAQEGRYPFRQTEMLLEQVAPDLQQKFLSLTAGSVLEPTPRADGYVLCRLLAKHEPTLADPTVRQRIEQRILDRHFADLISGRVQWRLMLSTAS